MEQIAPRQERFSWCSALEGLGRLASPLSESLKEGGLVKLSDARMLYLARESLTRLRDENLVQIPNFQAALRQARELLAEWVEMGDAVDLAVRKKIASLKRGVVEGSAEWSILYRRYREDELRKKGPQR